MQTLLAVPVILKVLASLGVILLINRISKSLLGAIVGGTVLLGIWCGHDATALGAIVWVRMSETSTLWLIAVVFQVIWLSCQMDKCHVMSDLVAAINARVGPRISMAILPAIIGMLPMPGGAVFSAPLVDRCDPAKELAPLLKTKINYWFRHVWEYWWPLYPGVLLAMQESGLPVVSFILLMMPLSLCAIGVGYGFLLQRVPMPENPANKTTNEFAKTHSLFSLLLPILVVVAAFAVITTTWSLLMQRGIVLERLNSFAPIAIGLIGALLTLQWQRPLPWNDWKEIFFSNKTLLLALLVLSIRVYGAMIEAELPDGTPLVAAMRSELDAAGVPLVLTIVLIPYLAGLTSGVAIGFVGASFPIVMNLIGPTPDTATHLATVVLAYVSGYAGMTLSPVHVCLIVTNEHFQTEIMHSIWRLARLMGVVWVAGAAYAAALYFTLG